VLPFQVSNRRTRAVDKRRFGSWTGCNQHTTKCCTGPHTWTEHFHWQPLWWMTDTRCRTTSFGCSETYITSEPTKIYTTNEYLAFQML
jgi:hypothetical protein